MMKKRYGFTLVETILASVILCGSVLAVGAISSRALTGTKFNRDYETALQLADRQLTLIDYIGIEEFINQRKNEGEFAGLEKKYKWNITTEKQEIDNLYRVNLSISWFDGDKSYSVSVATVLNAASSSGQ